MSGARAAAADTDKGVFFPGDRSRPQQGSEVTDCLLEPAKTMAYTKIQAALQQATRSSGVMTAGNAENLMLALLSSNVHKNVMVSCPDTIN